MSFNKILYRIRRWEGVVYFMYWNRFHIEFLRYNFDRDRYRVDSLCLIRCRKNRVYISILKINFLCFSLGIRFLRLFLSIFCICGGILYKYCLGYRSTRLHRDKKELSVYLSYLKRNRKLYRYLNRNRYCRGIGILYRYFLLWTMLYYISM